MAGEFIPTAFVPPYTEARPFVPSRWTWGDVAERRRFKSPDSGQLVITSLSDESVANSLGTMTEIANLDSPQNITPTIPDHEIRANYQEAFGEVYGSVASGLQSIVEDIYRKTGENVWRSGNYAIFAPLRGSEASISALMYALETEHGVEIDPSRIAVFQLSRQHLGDRQFWLKYSEGYMPPNLTPSTRIIVPDDCISLSVSAEASIQVAQHALYTQTEGQYRHFDRYPIITAAVGSQHGIMDLITSYEAQVVVGGVAYSIDKDGYLRRASGEKRAGDYYVGDMGDLTIPVAIDESTLMKVPFNLTRWQLRHYWEKNGYLPQGTNLQAFPTSPVDKR